VIPKCYARRLRPKVKELSIVSLEYLGFLKKYGFDK
jgi:hypothetical protein